MNPVCSFLRASYDINLPVTLLEYELRMRLSKERRFECAVSDDDACIPRTNMAAPTRSSEAGSFWGFEWPRV